MSIVKIRVTLRDIREFRVVKGIAHGDMFSGLSTPKYAFLQDIWSQTFLRGLENQNSKFRMHAWLLVLEMRHSFFRLWTKKGNGAVTHIKRKFIALNVQSPSLSKK